MSDAVRQLLGRHGQIALDPRSPTPLYHQLYSMLRDCIVGGVLADGTRMPSEKELAGAFNVSRITARRALHDLAADKLVARHRGRGTFVTYKYRPEPVNAPLVGMLESFETMGRQTKIKVLSLRFARPPAAVAEAFGLPHDRPLCHILRVRSHNSMPFAYYESWSIGFDRALTKQALERRPRLELLREAGVKIARIEQTLSAEAAYPAVAEALGVMPGKPLLKLVRRSFDPTGRQVDELLALYNPDRFQYQMSMSLHAGRARPAARRHAAQ